VLAASVFWALLLLPGLAALRRWAPGELERGAPSAVALGYAASFALLSPWSLACYALRLPAWVFSTCVGAAIVAAAAVLIRARAWRGLARRPDAIAIAGGAVLFAQLALAGRVGGWLDGDATYHLGRVRDLIDHGFSNRDFYVALESHNPTYAFNLMHALYASAVQLTQQDMLELWFASLPWAQLLIACGHYHLAQVVFGSRLAGWIAAVAIAVLRAPETYALYPNLLSVGCFAPLLLAQLFDSGGAGDRPRARAISVALLALVVGQTHALYFGFAALAAAPWLLGRLALDLGRRRRAPARASALCLCALLAGAPFAIAANYNPAPTRALLEADRAAAAIPYEPPPPARESGPRSHADQRADTPELQAGGGHLEKQLDRHGEGWVMPVERAGGALFIALGLAALALCAVRMPARRAAIVGLGVAALILLAIPLEPTLCTLFSRSGLPPFAVARMVTLAASLLVVAQSGAVALLLQGLRVPAAAHALAVLIAAAAATRAVGHAPRSYAEHVRQALSPAGEREALLRQHRAWRGLLRAHVAPGSVVLASQRDGRYLVMLHDVRIVAVDRGHAKLPGLPRRRDHVELMTAGKTAPSLRAQLLRHHGIGWVAYRSKYEKRFRWTASQGRVVGRSAELALVQLSPR
jgi:hypothetical protein